MQWKVFKFGSTYFDGGVASVGIEDVKDVSYVDLVGNRKLRVVDVPESPELRATSGTRITLEFGSEINQKQLDVLMRAHEFEELNILEMVVFDRDDSRYAETITESTRDTLKAASDYAYYFAVRRHIADTILYANGVSKTSGDATYGYTLRADLGRFQPNTPGNWSGATMAAAYDWEPPVRVDSIDPGPVRGTYPQKYRPKIVCYEAGPLA